MRRLRFHFISKNHHKDMTGIVPIFEDSIKAAGFSGNIRGVTAFSSTENHRITTNLTTANTKTMAYNSSTDRRRLAAMGSSDMLGEPIPQNSASVDDATWLKDFHQWANNNYDPVDTLHTGDLYPVIQAVSHFNIEGRLAMLSSIFQFADSNASTVTGLTDMIEVLKVEIEHINKHIGEYLSDFALSSPHFVDEYASLHKHARNTTDSDAHVAAIMTWCHGWPAGFHHLLRVLAVHTRRLDDLRNKRTLISTGRLDWRQFPSTWSALRYDDGIWPYGYGYGYERKPITHGLDFRPPPLQRIDSDDTLSKVYSAATIRAERRRSALRRLETSRGGVGDFLAPSYVDTWYHGFREWLDSQLPSLLHTHPSCARRWANLGEEIDEMHEAWIMEAEYQGPRVLKTKTAYFWLDKNQEVHHQLGHFGMPDKHTSICVELD